MAITKAAWGKTPEGSPVDLYTLTNARGMVAKVTTYGGILTELHAPDKQGKIDNIVLGFSTLASYLKGHPYFGATVGRYANRIAKGTFTLNGKTYHLPINNGPNSLHGGDVGFDKKVWEASASGKTLTLTLRSPDGDQGYPGNLAATVAYTLTDENELILTFEAVSDAPTPVNLCNHSYFNLAGAGQPSIMNHTLYLNASAYTPVNEELIPSGQIAPVADTPMDFTHPTTVGARAAQVPGGYDHNFVINHKKPHDLTLAATVTEPTTGRALDVLTTQPGVQFYAGNFLDPSIHGNGGSYPKNSGLCLETQHFPDSPNHPNFPSTILEPGRKYSEKTIYRFRTI